jgi:hypothetical protein
LTKLKLKNDELKKLRELTCTPKGNEYFFLGYALDLKTAELRDLLNEDANLGETETYAITVLLSHYVSAKRTLKSGNLIKFRDLPGGAAYERAFLQRAVQPIAQTFGANPSALLDAAKLLKGINLSHGDLSVEIPALEGISIVYILWSADEFAASASVLFDESASSYLPTEDLAVLAELTTSRLMKPKNLFRGSRYSLHLFATVFVFAIVSWQRV